MRKNSLTRYELERRFEWISFGYIIIVLSISFIFIFLYNADSFPWWVFIIIPLLAALSMLAVYQNLFLPLKLKSAHPEIEEMKKQRVSQKYFKLRLKKLILELVIISLIPLITLILYNLMSG